MYFVQSFSIQGHTPAILSITPAVLKASFIKLASDPNRGTCRAAVGWVVGGIETKDQTKCLDLGCGNDQNRKRPNYKMTKIENDQNRKRPKYKMTKIQNDQNTK